MCVLRTSLKRLRRKELKTPEAERTQLYCCCFFFFGEAVKQHCPKDTATIFTLNSLPLIFHFYFLISFPFIPLLQPL